ncbi:RidA family protein [Bacillus chungangensis]|uniref:Enamine deaminase RidA (YjgF/YER057c/UK114 family) n=1 Tax=Bacillus chungangensis TaxID=587633 RepID=A0ABT9WXE6_9BACI|nr:RidA family protein [Bacillus chungangensis]MDQ0177969.1 enamine deaminase RidA (YjgF/YER057c/UK114 family) [Bacillus chungangensis]
MNEKIIRTNPESMPKPLGNYTHITRVPKDAELFVTSGQVGVDMDGNVPSDFNEQVTNTFANIKKVLESEELNQDNIIKVNIWATEEIDWEHLDSKWKELFGSEYPAMTIAYISKLGLPELKIEIELWCAKV